MSTTLTTDRPTVAADLETTPREQADHLDRVLDEVCAVVGSAPPDDPAWPALLPWVHHLADTLTGDPWLPDPPGGAAVAARRLAHAVRRWRRGPRRPDRVRAALAAADVLRASAGSRAPQVLR